MNKSPRYGHLLLIAPTQRRKRLPWAFSLDIEALDAI